MTWFLYKSKQNRTARALKFRHDWNNFLTSGRVYADEDGEGSVDSCPKSWGI